MGDTTMAKMCSARPGGPLLTVLVENLKFIVSTMIIVVLSIWGEYVGRELQSGIPLYMHIYIYSRINHVEGANNLLKRSQSQ